MAHFPSQLHNPGARQPTAPSRSSLTCRVRSPSTGGLGGLSPFLRAVPGVPLGQREPLRTPGRRSPVGASTAQLPVPLLLSVSPRTPTRPKHWPCPKTGPWSRCNTTARSSRGPPRVLLLLERRRTKERKEKEKPQTQTSRSLSAAGRALLSQSSLGKPWPEELKTALGWLSGNQLFTASPATLPGWRTAAAHGRQRAGPSSAPPASALLCRDTHSLSRAWTSPSTSPQTARAHPDTRHHPDWTDLGVVFKAKFPRAKFG